VCRLVSAEELDRLFSLLKKFADAFGVSGYEDEIRDLVVEEVRDYADEIWIDRLGNVVAVKYSGVEGAPRIVVDAHMDEIGFIVKHIDDKGFVYLAPIGGWSDIVLPGQRIRIRTRDGRLVYGVIGSKPPHVMTPEEAKQVPTIDKLFVDIGVSSREEAEKLGVHVGAPADLDREAVRIGYKRATGKAFDDRVGVLVAVESFKKLAQRQIQADLYLVIASQEEVGLKGARTAAYAINPDIAIALDVTIAADVPGVEESKHISRVGKGPAIKVVDGKHGTGTLANRKLVELLVKVAEEEKIPYQIEVATGGTTDATAIQLTREGVAVATISIPTRYIHSPVELLDLEDVYNAIRLVVAAIERIDRRWVEENVPRKKVIKGRSR